MRPDFDLVVTADSDTLTTELQLLDAAGTQVAYHTAKIGDIPAATVQGLFNLREFVRMYAAKPGETGRNAEELVADLGVKLARDLLGPEIFGALSSSDDPRTLRIKLPAAETNRLASALARVPWEIARGAVDQPTLAEKNLILRAVVGSDPTPKKLTLAKDEALRVLFIFAEAPGSRPLAARQEREQLLELFEKEIYSQRRVEADFLAHGVTRERLTGLITDRHGYHIVHWSGHGHQNLLELAGTDGRPDRLSGEELVKLLSNAGGFKPQLFFLSACHSGDMLNIKDWAAFQAVAEGRDPVAAKVENTGETVTKQLDSPGYTGTAHALLRAGVPSVVAMRYSVGDDYARDLAVDFYGAILAAKNPASVAEALNLSRKRLRIEEMKSSALNYEPCDHATPVLYGLANPELTPPKGKSAYKSLHNPRLGVQICELDIREHPYFIGRTWELAGLGANFIGYQRSSSVKPVALVQGIGGMGKTALVAEALDLWEKQFDWVLLFQAKPNQLNLDNTLREIHGLLYAELKTYHDHVQENPADAIWRTAEGEGEDAFRGERRMDRLRRNFARAMEDEAILLVLDNFETNLKEKSEKNAAETFDDPVWACQDPAWDELLHTLATELAGTASRVLITCRRPLAALPATQHYRVLLGPLPAGEAALYLRSHPGLRGLMFSQDASDRQLATRLFYASRFHPLLLDRLARLVAGGVALRAQLDDALQALESAKGYNKLPELFTTRAAGATDVKELEYLRDALEKSIDLLLHHAGPDARLLLWVIALANDPVTLALLSGVWSGEDLNQEQARQLKNLLENLDQLPPDLRTKLEAMPLEFREAIMATPPTTLNSVPSIEPLLSFLITVGLVTAERQGSTDDNPAHTCHELVRERILGWMVGNPGERMGREESSVFLAYAERLESVFRKLLHEDATAALEAGRHALVYYVQAKAYNRLGGFASKLVTFTANPRLVNALLPHLHTAAQTAPAGKAHWSCLTYLADALRQGGGADASLSFYEQAATEAKAAEDWGDLAWITGNWANAFFEAKQFGESRAKHLESAEAERRARSPQVNVISSELEAYRIDIMEGRATALSVIDLRVAELESWWYRTRTLNETVPEAPEVESLARALISALDIALHAHCDQSDWEAALRRGDRILEIRHELHRPAEEIARDRMNRAVVLMRLLKYGEAQRELEACLKIFEGHPAASSKVLSSLADLFDEQDDVPQAIELERRALAMCEQLPDPEDRAISHHNLAIYLHETNTPSVLVESTYHRLAALVYETIAGLGAAKQRTFRNYANQFRRAKASGITYMAPRLADLLAQPAFSPLLKWLHQRNVNLEELQTDLDQFLEMARQAGES